VSFDPKVSSSKPVSPPTPVDVPGFRAPRPPPVSPPVSPLLDPPDCVLSPPCVRFPSLALGLDPLFSVSFPSVPESSVPPLLSELGPFCVLLTSPSPSPPPSPPCPARATPGPGLSIAPTARMEANRTNRRPKRTARVNQREWPPIVGSSAIDCLLTLTDGSGVIVLPHSDCCEPSPPWKRGVRAARRNPLISVSPDENYRNNHCQC
jgi:hypothetical protein